MRLGTSTTFWESLIRDVCVYTVTTILKQTTRNAVPVAVDVGINIDIVHCVNDATTEVDNR